MVVIVTEKNKSSSLKEQWANLSKKELFDAIAKYKQFRFSLFRVGPDDFVIQEGKLINSPAGTHLFIDKNGFICGFTDSSVSNRIDRWSDNDKTFNFNIGRAEFKLYVEIT